MGLKCLKIILEVIKGLLDIGIFICVIILCTLSSKDPFKSHIIGSMSNYFKNIQNSTDSIEHICVCNNVTLDQECTIENINQGCVNISSNIIEFKPFLLRKLSSRSFVLICKIVLKEMKVKNFHIFLILNIKQFVE